MFFTKFLGCLSLTSPTFSVSAVRRIQKCPLLATRTQSPRVSVSSPPLTKPPRSKRRTRMPFSILRITATTRRIPMGLLSPWHRTKCVTRSIAETRSWKRRLPRARS
ncbi:hypothetical protein BDV28DRAFT_102815 [Aspergillus coremiiformis]|uniref:Secreted protein n=1 Tax=Aspergillus coremiiformis TaxID=138285 RepID=A0A5N6ZFH8_9EURO|nr:hypothetical protein BDV28DRAFT_102815 [Aspergillus coremiiformis]